MEKQGKLPRGGRGSSRRGKRIAAALICLCLVMALLPAAALADNIEIELSALTAGAYGPGWTYNITNNSLLLGAHNYTFTGGTFTCSIDIKDGTISSGTFSGEVDNYGTIVSARSAVR